MARRITSSFATLRLWIRASSSILDTPASARLRCLPRIPMPRQAAGLSQGFVSYGPPSAGLAIQVTLMSQGATTDDIT